MSKVYKEIDLVQGSTPWLEYRKNKISATDTGKILGFNPFCTSFQLWEEKLGLREPQAVNDKMREGSLLEEEARVYFNKLHETDFKPVVLEHIEYPFMMSSLDGMNSKGEILEIKCGKKSYEIAMSNTIEPYYYSQLQKQMLVSGCDEITYFCYRSESETIEKKYYRDESYIKKIIEAEKEFYQCLLNFTPPPLTDRDYVQKDDKDWRMIAHLYNESCKELDEAERKNKDLRNELIKMANGNSCKGYGVTVSKSIRRGNIDYASIDILKDVDLDQYRKKASEVWTVRIEKNKD